MYVAAGLPFTATLLDPGGISDAVNLGARVETPINRAIVSYWRAATLAGIVWSVELDAPLGVGEYELVWVDDLDPPTFEGFVPLYATSADIAIGDGVGGGVQWPELDVNAITPSVDDVAALERTRTVDEGGNEQGTFTPDTRPTDSEVQALIDEAIPQVLAQLRPTFPESYYGQVTHSIALYTAILIEGSFFREQLNEGSVALWRNLFTTTLAGVSSGIEAEFDSSGAGLRLV